MATILVIEDEDLMRSTVAKCLRYAGHTVVEARDGREGLQCHALGSGDFDLVVCDLILPGLGGIETIRLLHARAASLPILAISGAINTLAYLNSRGPVWRACLAKPFSSMHLLETVQRLLPESACDGLAPIEVGPDSTHQIG
jgi:CheY-like chemotaxis protein